MTRVWIVAAALFALLLAACPSHDAQVVRYAAQEHACPESRTAIAGRDGPYRWRLNVCGESLTYESGGNGTPFHQVEAYGSESSGGGGGGEVYVHGYTRRDGTRVRAHTRSRPR